MTKEMELTDNMNIEELYSDLSRAYSNENLNSITGKLILLYKNKNFGMIREIANRISEYVIIDEEQDAKCFSKLIMLYHPDKGEHFRKTIGHHYNNRDYENLSSYSHILKIGDPDNISVYVPDEDIDYYPEYMWDMKPGDGYSYRNFDGESDFEGFYDDEFERSFYNMIKIRQYGNPDADFPTYYLEDYEEYEMAYSGLETLDGVEYCIHVKILNISNNSLLEIDNLWGLRCLEELYLSNNQIINIDALVNLVNLRVLDLSGNMVNDISSLLRLDNLEYVNLLGNPVPEYQIEKLREMGVLVTNE